MELWILWRTTSVKLHLLATLILVSAARSGLFLDCWNCVPASNPVLVLFSESDSPCVPTMPCPCHFAACFIYLFLTINFIKFKLLRQEKCYLTSKVLFYLSFWCWITKALFLISAFSDQRNRSRDNSDCD